MDEQGIVTILHDSPVAPLAVAEIPGKEGIRLLYADLDDGFIEGKKDDYFQHMPQRIEDPIYVGVKGKGSSDRIDMTMAAMRVRCIS